MPLPASVHATIRYRNLIGQRYLALTEGPAPAASCPRRRADPACRRPRPALDLTVLFNGFRPLFTALTPQDVNSLAYEIIQVLQGEGGTVTDLLQHTASLTTTLADRDAVIGQVITNLNDGAVHAGRSTATSCRRRSRSCSSSSPGWPPTGSAIGTAIENIGGLTSRDRVAAAAGTPGPRAPTSPVWTSLAGIAQREQRRHRHAHWRSCRSSTRR